MFLKHPKHWYTARINSLIFILVVFSFKKHRLFEWQSDVRVGEGVWELYTEIFPPGGRDSVIEPSSAAV